MKNIVFIAIFLVLLSPHAPAFASQTIDTPVAEQPIKKPPRNKKKNPPMPVTPGSQVIVFKDKITAEIRPDKSVWWFGVNYKKALMADGVHELMDGQKITTKGGKLVGKKPRPMAESAPKKPEQ
jgi:hypothetical protein